MAASTPSLTERPAWKALQAHYNQVHNRHLRTLFSEDPDRGTRLTLEALVRSVPKSALILPNPISVVICAASLTAMRSACCRAVDSCQYCAQGVLPSGFKSASKPASSERCVSANGACTTDRNASG